MLRCMCVYGEDEFYRLFNMISMYCESYNWEFFFSSSRRHTRSKREWSSDVCSSDLDVRIGVPGDEQLLEQREAGRFTQHIEGLEIGRASCREKCRIRGWPNTEKKILQQKNKI